MSPDWLLQEFSSTLFWVSLLMIFVECGLLFPFLQGDTLLFARAQPPARREVTDHLPRWREVRTRGAPTNIPRSVPSRSACASLEQPASRAPKWARDAALARL